MILPLSQHATTNPVRTHSRNTMLFRVSLPVLFALLGTSISGCSTATSVEEEPIASVSPSAAAEAPTPRPAEESTAPDDEKPVPTVQMDDTGKEGAQAATEFFLDLIEYTVINEETSLFQKYTHSECSYCQRITELVSSFQDSSYSDRELKITPLTQLHVKRAHTTWVAIFDMEYLESYKSQGEVHQQRQEYSTELHMYHDGKSWKLLDLTVTEA